MREIILRPVTSEKAVRLMESQNTLTLMVDQKASKDVIKKVVEKIFKAKVININTLNTNKNEKKAYVRLSSDSNALDIGAELGVI